MTGPAPLAYSRMIFGLVREIPVATRIAEKAKEFPVVVYHSDRAESFFRMAGDRKPILVILDWDACEAECFRFLNQMKEYAELRRKLPVVGYVSQSKEALKEEAVRAGCDRVYGKSEFFRSLHDIFVRYIL